MRRLSLLVASIALATAGCIGGEDLDPTSADRAGGLDGVAPGPGALDFTEPLQLNPEGLYGYEPSIHVDEQGTIYVTAHKDSLLHEDERLASWLWYSNDGGESFRPMPSPAQVHEKLFAFEGDFATDDEGRLYFMDTYAADNTLSHWDVSGEEPAWEMTRPVHGTTGIDDRPWMAAHGDGIVYYAANNGAPLPAVNNVQQGPDDASRYWLYVSEDAGRTWSAGYGFPSSGWCTVAADPTDDRTVYVGCDRSTDSTLPGLGPSQVVTVYASMDRGQTFTEHEVASFEHGLTDGYPNVAVDAAGTPYVAWPDGDYSEDSTTTVNYAYRAANGSWVTREVTPHEGSFDEVWASGGEDGTLALTFYGTNDTQPGDETEWFAYAAVSTDADSPDPTWHVERIDPEPVETGPGSPDDFFMNDVGPDDRLHVTYQRVAEDVEQDPTHPTRGGASDLLYVQQTIGPNIGTSDTSQLPD